MAALPPAEDHRAGRIFDIEVDGERHIGLALVDAGQSTLLLRRAAAGAALFDFLGAVPFAGAILEHFLTNPYQAITVVDHTGHIRFISPVHEAFFGLRAGEGTGRPAEQVIPNSRLGHVVATGKAEIGQLQRMNGVTRVVNRGAIVADGKTVGAIGQVLFKEPEAIGRMHKEVEELRSQLAHYRRELHGLRQRDAGAGGVGLLIGERADAAAAPGNRDRGAAGRTRAGAGRVWHGQGTRGAGHPQRGPGGPQHSQRPRAGMATTKGRRPRRWSA